MKARAHVYVSGRVQGVFYRSAIQYEAVNHDLTGWVRNLSDGRVEAVFEGEKEDVERMIDFCWKGSRRVVVAAVDCGNLILASLSASKRFDDFQMSSHNRRYRNWMSNLPQMLLWAKLICKKTNS